MPHLPHRITCALHRLAVAPGDRVLEIGCGKGLAIELLCEQLGGRGQVTGIDRSALAIASARARNQRFIDEGIAQLRQVALAEAAFDQPFGQAFAVNVNLFWLSPARELAVLRRALVPGGRLQLFYEAPSPDQLAHIESACCRHLSAAGFRVAGVARDAPEDAPVLCIEAVVAEV